MKPRILSTARLSFPLASAIAALLAAPFAMAQNARFWDPASSGNFGSVDGTITWASPLDVIWTNSNTGNSTRLGNHTTSLTDDCNFGGPTASLGVVTTTPGTTDVIPVSTVNAGTLSFNTLGSNLTLSGGTITLKAASSITTVNPSQSHRITSVLAGAATSLTKAGAGTLILSGASTYAGATIINAGTLNLGGATANGSLASPTLTLGGGAFSYTRTGSTTQGFTTTNINAGGATQISVVSGNILNLGTVVRGAGGALDFASTGAGTVAALAASNDATGIMAGFTFGNNWAVANGAGVAISGLSSYTLTSVAGTSGSNYTGAHMDVDSSEGLIDAVITTNSLRFSEADANTMTLANGTNTITTGGILVNSTVGSNLSTITGGPLTGLANKDLAIIQNNTSGGLTISSNLVNTTLTSVTKSGSGLLTLGGNNTFTGGVVIHGGTVALGNAGALNSTVGSQNAVSFGASSTGMLALAGNNVVVANLSTNATPGTTFVQNANGSSVANATLTVGNSTNANGTFAGIIRDGTGGGTLALTKAGNGTLTLSGANTYSGGTTLTAGTVAISNATSFGASTGAVTVTGASRINATGGITYANDINVGTQTLTMQNPATTASSTATFSGVLSGSGTISLPNSGVNGIQGIIAFTNPNNTFTGNVVLSTSSSGDEFFSFNSIGDAGNFTIQKSGNRQGIIYAGSSNIAFDTRQIVLGTTLNSVTDGGGGNPANSFQNNGSGTVTFNTNIVPTTVGGTTATLFFGGSNTGNNTFAGIINNTTSGNPLAIGKFGAGTWILSGANTYAGTTFIGDGILSVNAIAPITTAQPLGRGSLIQFSVGNSGTSGTLVFTGGSNSTTDKQVLIGTTTAASTGSGSILNNGVGTLSFSNATFNPTITGVTVTRTLTLGGTNTGANAISGIIQNNAAAGLVALSKAGVGTWVLAGANTYTGGTAISGGTLDLANVKGLGNSGTLDIDAASTTRLSTDTAFGGSNPVYNVKIDAPGSYTSTIELNRATPGAVTGITHNFGTMLISLNGGGGATVNVTAGANAPTGGAVDTIVFTSLSAGNNNAVTQTFNPTGGNITFGTVQSSTGNASITTIALSGTTAGNAITGVIGGINVNQNSVAITKNGASTWTLSGASTFTGNVAINGGILAVNSIADAGTSALGLGTGLTLNGGTLSYTGAGAASTSRSVSLSTNSGIDLPNGSLTISSGIAGNGFILTKSGSGLLSLVGATDNGSLFLNAANGTVELGKTLAGSAVAGISGISAGASVQLTGTNGNQIYDGPFFVSTNGVSGLNGTLDVNGKNETTSNFNGGSTGVLDNASGTPSTFTIGNQNVNSTFAGTIQNTGANLAITKIGSGTLTLSGLNTFTGNTAVNAGTLALADNAQLKFVLGATSGVNNSISGAGTVTLNGDFVIDTTAADALSTGTWTLENVSTLTGAYGSSFTVVGFTDAGSDKWTKINGSKIYTFDETTGILTLAPNASYASWAAINAIGSTPTQDKDGDGVSNAVEYVLGGSVITNDLSKLPAFTTSGSNMVFTFERKRSSIDGNTTIAVEVGTTLASWPDVYDVGTTTANSDLGVTVLEDDPTDFDTITLTVPIGSDPKKFARLNVTVTE